MTWNPAAEFFRPLLAPVETLRHYNLRKLKSDLVAGATVSVVEVPQAMAYAIIAGVPPEMGLYTSIVQAILGSLFTSNEHLATGPTNTQALLTASIVSRLTQKPELYLPLVCVLALVKGAIQLICAAARLGSLVRYVSQAVIVGFTAGAGVLIAVGQIPNLLGLKHLQTPQHLPGITGELAQMLPHIGEINLRSLVVGLSCLAGVIACRMVSRWIPGPLLAVCAAAAVTWAAGWDDAQLAQIGPIPRQLPGFSLPALSLDKLPDILPGALAIALLGMIETVAIGKSLATQSGKRIHANQEFFAQGLANLASSFFGCMPGSGSFTRSKLEQMAGGATRFAGVFNSLLIVVILLAFAPQARYIPLTSLAAVLFSVAFSLLDWQYILRIVRTNRSDAIVCLTTFVATLLLPLEYAIYAGVFLNLVLYLRQASQLRIAEMVGTPGGPFHERPVCTREGRKAVLFLQLEGDLFFGVADELQDRLSDLAASGVKVVILRLKRTHYIDSTVLGALEHFIRGYQKKGGYVLLCGVKPELMQVLGNFGLVKLLGAENVFPAAYGVFTSAKLALARARHLVGESIDTAGLAQEHEKEDQEAWTYQI